MGPISFLRRVCRWVRYDGWRGSLRRFRQLGRYWRFRFLVHRIRPRFLAATAGSAVRPASPVFSILLVAYRTKPGWLREAVESVRRQSFRHWELRIGLHGIDADLRVELLDLARKDGRVKVLDLPENLGIAANTNAIAQGAAGEFLAILDHDDTLEPHTLQEFAPMAHSGLCDMIYSDEHIIARWGIPLLPMLKPDWAPDSLLSYNYICHFCCFRRTLFESIGGFNTDFEGAQDYDLFLRLTEKTSRIAHVPKVLYHWRRHSRSTAGGGDAKPAAWEAGRRAVEAHLQRMKLPAAVALGPYFGTLHVRYVHDRGPSVETILAASASGSALRTCLDAIARATSYPRHSVKVMLSGQTSTTDLEPLLRGRDWISTAVSEGVPGSAHARNEGARKSQAEILIFLDEAVEVVQRDWIEGLLEHAMRPVVGAVGPLLVSPAGSIVHSGFAVDASSIRLDFHENLPQHTGGYAYRVKTVQNVSAVSHLCLGTRRELFLKTGGFDGELSVDAASIDYCLRLLAAERRIVYTPHVRAIVHDAGITKISRHAKSKILAKHGKEGLRERFFDTSLLRDGNSVKAFVSGYFPDLESEQ